MSEIQQRSRVLDDVRSGSREALGELYRAHADAVFALAYRLTGSREDAEDVLQDVFVGLSHALASYTERGRFESWLKRVTARTALMRMRSRRRRREDPIDPLAESSAVVRQGDADAASAHVVDRLAMQTALGRLPQSLRAVFLLREVEGYAHDEIGDLLGISARASATRLSRAWSLLRKELTA
ncbi:MAG TPA: sigma-70 family RNA polymerase sigma factor [Longimicrobiales bacterium]|nr:sigma-70 family RNA polymerase sigma factor [Longimicrobiales bacterium]